MSTTKVVVIILVIVILLFLVLMVWGSYNNSTQKPPNDSQAAAISFNPGEHSNFGAFSEVLSPYAPTLKASALRLAHAEFDLGSQASYPTITVPKDEDHKFRQAKFLVQPAGCAHVLYLAPAAVNVDEHLRKQDSNTPAKDSQPPPPPPAEFKLTILDTPGTLEIARNLPLGSPCKVVLE